MDESGGWGGEREDFSYWERTPEPGPEPDSSSARYVCARCKQELFPENLFEVKYANYEQSNLRIMYSCECSPEDTALYAIYPFNPNALYRMFGYVVQIPWPHSEARIAATSGPGVELGTNIPQWRPENDQDMKVWNFHLDGVDTADDFLNFHPGNKYDDERTRRRFRDTNPGD